MRSFERIRVPGILGMMAVVACVSSVSAQQAPRLSGTVTYRERIALAPTAVLEVRLDDVTRAGGVPPVIAQLRLEQPGQVPIKFDMSYPVKAIDPRGRYAVRATISDGGVVLFTSLDTALVLTQGHGAQADLVLTRVAGAKLPAAPVAGPPPPPLPPMPFTNLPATFAGTLPCEPCAGDRYHLNLFADDSFFLRMTLAGKPGEPKDEIGSWALSSDRRVLVLHGQSGATRMFAVPAPGTLKQLDAAGRPIAGSEANEIRRAPAFRPLGVRLNMRGVYAREQKTFTECSTGQTWPVAVAASQKDLDAAYAGSRSALGAIVLAEIDGEITPPAADGSATQNALTVNKVARLLPKESCAPRFTNAPLTDTHWRLTHLGSRAMTAPADPRREPSLTFQASEAPPTAASGGGAFAGSGGCNRIIGTYTVANATMALTTAGTMMACKDDPAMESAFVAALKATRRYRIVGRTLELMDDKTTLARFEARPASGITVR